MRFVRPKTPLALIAVVLCSACNAVASDQPVDVVFIAQDELADRIHGGMLGQIIGNLNGLPHEAKYIAEPGNVSGYVPALPDGARTDDDTDLEWVYVTAIEREGAPLLPYDEVRNLWRRHVNDGIWCANRYARDLMELGLAPPLTGRGELNPWAEFNLSGQFVCESFGLMAPAMPQTAARIGLHYTHVAIDGEPAQTTQLFTAMIAMAFLEHDVERLIDVGLAAVDPASEVAGIVRQTRDICGLHPDDWRAARSEIQRRWQVHNGSMRDWNGYELNTACTIAALVYGRGDIRTTLETAFNLGWDCDNNAATAATILGVIEGKRRLDAQGWTIKDVYRNTTRPGMPSDETISSFADRVVACARLAILQNGGQETTHAGRPGFEIPRQPPQPVESRAEPMERLRQLRDELKPAIVTDLAGDEAKRAQAAYLAICLGLAAEAAQDHPADWSAAVAQLREHKAVLKNIAEAPGPSGDALRAAWAKWKE